MTEYKPENPHNIADFWEQWCGKTPWSTGLRRFADLGGQIIYYCGLPRSHSAIPLTFVLCMPDGTKIDGAYRLKDIRRAVALLERA